LDLEHPEPNWDPPSPNSLPSSDLLKIYNFSVFFFFFFLRGRERPP
jgi:hypothetical protein